MEIKVLLCNCKGPCDSFKDSDMNKLPFEVESDLDVKYTVLSPQLCGQGGNAILEEAMKTAGPDSYLLVGACAPKAQEKLFKKLIRATGFNEKHFVPVDIRSTDNNGILDRLREAVGGILKQEEAEARHNLRSTYWRQAGIAPERCAVIGSNPTDHDDDCS